MHEGKDETPEIVYLAREILILWRQAKAYRDMEEDRDYWRDKYNQLLKDDIKRGQETTGMILTTLLNKAEQGVQAEHDKAVSA